MINNNENNNKIKGKIAIMSEEDNYVEANVSEIFGRASYIHIFESGEFKKTIKNPFKFGGGGAGNGVLQLLVNENISKVFAGKIGDKIKPQLIENNIEFEEISSETKVIELI